MCTPVHAPAHVGHAQTLQDPDAQPRTVAVGLADRFPRTPGSARGKEATTTTNRHHRTVKADINKRIAAHVSWSRTTDRKARTQPGRDKFLERFEREVDPDGTLPTGERRQRAEHAKRAYMLRLARRSALARRDKRR